MIVPTATNIKIGLKRDNTTLPDSLKETDLEIDSMISPPLKITPNRFPDSHL
jgi:hypothetical protein